MPTRDWSTLLIPLLASLTLGLAPFLPEPHVIGKLRWAAGGGNGMAVIDWLDLGFHGLPWLWLAWAALRFFRQPAPS
jgi:apolipoprotein N-acyltransferase